MVLVLSGNFTIAGLVPEVTPLTENVLNTNLTNGHCAHATSLASYKTHFISGARNLNGSAFSKFAV